MLVGQLFEGVREVRVTEFTGRDVEREPEALGQVFGLSPQDQLGKGPVERPPAQGFRHPDLAGDVQELTRQKQALLGPLPTEQRLGPHHLATVEVHDRLVEESQLAIVHGALEPVLDFMA